MIDKLDIEIIKTGSDGNCVKISNLLVDLGITIKELKNKDVIDDIETVFITHKHSDHLKVSTLNHLSTKRVITNKDVAEQCDKISFRELYVLEDGDMIALPEYDMHVFQVPHSVETFGFWIDTGSETLLYATDLSNVIKLPTDVKFDYILLESNYDEFKLRAVIHGGNSSMAKRAYQNERHLSKQESRKYAAKHLKKGGKYIELHKSGQFY